MGKKEKKDNKPAPEDIFDPLNVESHQAYTAVLLLDSSEEDILGKACESIFKFADKCDDNKRTLLDMGVMERLLPIMLHDDRVIRKNSTAAFGVLTQSPDVRRQLRKFDTSVTNLVTLLSPNEEPMVQEYSALGLSQMALEYTSKTMILESGGMEPLVKGLTSNDPDVQKNCIETIALLLMDFKGRITVREFEGLPPILNLVMSEYAIIQQLAILALDRSAQDPDCRAIMRELEAVPKLVDVVSHADWSDIHVQAVQVLSHLLEDTATLEQIKETGGLKRLVAIITDQSPPEEESKKDKKATSKTGKKSAKADSKKKEEEKEEKEGEGIIPTLPDVKICASHAIARSARNADNRRLLHEMEVEKMLILLLSHENHEVQAAAGFALAVMAEYILSRDSIREWEGFPPLVKMLHVDNTSVKEACTCALANLTTANQSNCLELEHGTAIDHLVNILADPCMPVVANAANVLMNIAADDSLRATIQSKGVVESLLAPLNSGHVEVQSRAALAVASFVCDAETRAELCSSGALEALVPLLDSGNDDLRRNACWAIAVCAVDEPTAIEICRLGGMEILQTIQNSVTRENVFAEAALSKLLDSSLSAKFALTGVLSSSNLIGDKFYDAGRLRPDKPFMTLEELLQEDLSDRRPVITINSKQTPHSSATFHENGVKVESSKNNVSGKSSRTGRESKSKSRSQKEKEEKAREEELATQLKELSEEQQTVKTCPLDPTFAKYIEEVQESIEPLATSREQVVALAVFVSDKMGGSIERDAISQFSWELPLSQIMYDIKSNVVPIGLIRSGIHIHRALLFKALADRIALSCTLIRGDYNRAWNEVMLSGDVDESSQESLPEYPASMFVVDLIHEPSRLLIADSPEAIAYISI